MVSYHKLRPSKGKVIHITGETQTQIGEASGIPKRLLYATRHHHHHHPHKQTLPFRLGNACFRGSNTSKSPAVPFGLKVTIASCLLFLVFLAVPIFEFSIRACLATTLLMATWWMMRYVPIGITSFVPVVVFPMCGIMTAKEIASAYYSDTIFLLIGTCIIALALERTNALTRIAFRALSAMPPHPRGVLFMFMLMTAILSIFVSNTAAAAVVCPIIVQVRSTLKKAQKQSFCTANNMQKCDLVPISEMPIVEKSRSHRVFKQPPPRNTGNRAEANQEGSKSIDAKAMKQTELNVTEVGHTSIREYSSDQSNLLTPREVKPGPLSENCPNNSLDIYFARAGIGVAFAAAVGGMASLTGTGPNVVLASAVSQNSDIKDLDWGEFFVFGIPLSATMLLLIWFCLAYIKFPKQVHIDMSAVAMRLNELGKVGRAEATTLMLLALLVLLWLFRAPGWLPRGFGWAQLMPVPEDVSDATAAMFVSLLLFIIPNDEVNARQMLIKNASNSPLGGAIGSIENQTKDMDVKSRDLEAQSDDNQHVASENIYHIPNNRQNQEDHIDCRGTFVDRKNDSNHGTGHATSSHTAILTWKFFVERFPHGLVLLIAGGCALSEGFAASGLDDAIIGTIATLQAYITMHASIVLLMFVAATLSQCTSNGAAASILMPLAATLAEAENVDPRILMLPSALSCSLAFLLPISTPPNAFVFEAGLVTQGQLLRWGFLFVLGGLVLILVNLVLLGPLVLGLSFDDLSTNSTAEGSEVNLATISSSRFLNELPTTYSAHHMSNRTTIEVHLTRSTTTTELQVMVPHLKDPYYYYNQGLSSPPEMPNEEDISGVIGATVAAGVALVFVIISLFLYCCCCGETFCCSRCRCLHACLTCFSSHHSTNGRVYNVGVDSISKVKADKMFVLDEEESETSAESDQDTDEGKKLVNRKLSTRKNTAGSRQKHHQIQPPRVRTATTVRIVERKPFGIEI